MKMKTTIGIQMKMMIDKLRKLGVQFKNDNMQSADILSGASSVVTGKVENYSRKEIKDAIESNGGKLSSSVSSKLDYLLAGDKPGSKLKKAQQLKTVKIISEKEFMDVLYV